MPKRTGSEAASFGLAAKKTYWSRITKPSRMKRRAPQTKGNSLILPGENSMRKYSIILPVRNGGVYVRECINAILAQTLDDFNLIILDNCSTDGTTEWIASLNDGRIVCHRSAGSLSIEENWGRIKDIPKNEFMTMIGHDDILDPCYLEVMDALIRRHPGASLYQTHFRYIDPKGSTIRLSKPMDERQTAPELTAFILSG